MHASVFRWVRIFAGIGWLAATVAAAGQMPGVPEERGAHRVEASAAPAFFAFDNGVGRGVWSPAQQAATLRELGFDGISYNYTNPGDLKVWLAELAQRELTLYALFFGVALEGDGPLPPGLVEAVELLRGSRTALWMFFPEKSPPDGYKARVVARVREVADLAAEAGLRVVLYPHVDCVPATAEEALTLVEAAERTNVGLTVNLSHELAAGNGARLAEVIRHVAPRLELVSINGATDQPGPLWKNYIKVLGEGDYDVAALLRTLRDAGYAGPIGLQQYAVEGDRRKNLEASMRAWRAMTGANAP